MHSIEKIVVAGVVSLVEASALPVNDNLTIPLSAAILLKLVI
jgi:dolichol kinase